LQCGRQQGACIVADAFAEAMLRSQLQELPFERAEPFAVEIQHVVAMPAVFEAPLQAAFDVAKIKVREIGVEHHAVIGHQIAGVARKQSVLELILCIRAKRRRQC
jgi:hypothetical protein